ncbi:MAG: TatD family hydrolase [Candidatus Bipolaricaulota bacterium]
MTAYRLIDSHAHLTSGQYDEDRKEVISRARREGVGVLEMGVDLPTSELSVELGERYDGIFSAVGFHPHEARHFADDSLERLRRLADSTAVKAVGEIGLDYYRDLSPRDVQKEVFVNQLGLAEELDLPVSIHNRESTEEMLMTMESLDSLPEGVIHSYSGGYELALEFIELGFHLGISGPLTFKGEESFRRAVGRVPLEKLLVETDSPYLTPQPHRGKRNEPIYVKYIAEAIAQSKGTSVDEVCRVTTENARRLFEIDGDQSG